MNGVSRKEERRGVRERGIERSREKVREVEGGMEREK